MDGVDFPNRRIRLPFGDVRGHQFGRAIQHPLEIIIFGRILHFDQDQFLIFLAFGQQIDAVELIGVIRFIALAFQDVPNPQIFL